MRGRILMLLAAAAAIASVAPAAARAMEPQAAALVEEWKGLNSACRGGSGDDPKTLKACDRREEVSRSLVRLGWCYGLEGDAGYQRYWRRCDGSLR